MPGFIFAGMPLKMGRFVCHLCVVKMPLFILFLLYLIEISSQTI